MNLRLSFLRVRSVPFFIAALAGMPVPVLAQQAPDAGRSLQEIRQQRPDLPQASQRVDLSLPETAPATPGGEQVSVRSVAFSGNMVFDDATLRATIGDVVGNSYDLAGLKALADRITMLYRDDGYPFARALIPAQDLSEGNLQITIIEGRYGQARIVSMPEASDETAQAQAFLYKLEPGRVIKGDELERATLILSDQPGYTVTPVMRPGAESGTGDLEIGLKQTKRYGGDVSIDNHGNRYTGRGHVNAGVYANSVFNFGDQLRADGLYTEEDMWLGSAGYSMPVGGSGLRASLGYSHTYYELGKEFSMLDAYGTAKTASAGLSYPLVRSQKANLSVGVQYQHKWLTDNQGAVGTEDKKTSDSLPVTLGFDRRDALGGGGITYGSISWTHGILDLDNSLAAIDAATARTNGAFDKFNLDIARLQSLPLGLQLFGRFAGQLAADNLDSSEGFGVGGMGGVRAYPSGEGYGDEGALGQVELRYPVEIVTPYAFYDVGRVTINHDNFAPGVNHRSIGGAGLGVRANWEGWKADTSIAWRTHGGDPVSDSKDETPRLNFMVGRNF